MEAVVASTVLGFLVGVFQVQVMVPMTTLVGSQAICSYRGHQPDC